MTANDSEPGELLSFREHGSGMPVVFLHPTPLDHAYWLPLVERLRGVRAILPDLRGHGASPLGVDLPEGDFDLVPDAQVLSMHRLAADVLALLDALKVQEAVFVGCSIGGYTLLELWRQAPERMRGLAFVCSKPQPDSAIARQKRLETILRARNEGVAGIFDGQAESLVGASTRAQRPYVVAEVRARMTLTARAVVAVQAGLAVRPDSLATVATISAPVLAIAGGEDPGVSAEEMREFRNTSGQTEFHLLPDAGHFAAYERPEQVGKLLQKWLQPFQG